MRGLFFFPSQEPILRSGGLQLLGRREGAVKGSSAAAAGGLPQQRRGAPAGLGDADGSRARYAVMVQTGDFEVSLAPLGAWVTFRPLQIAQWAPASHAAPASGAADLPSSGATSSSSGAELGGKAAALVAAAAAASATSRGGGGKGKGGGAASAKRSALLQKLRSDGELRATSDPALAKESSLNSKGGRGGSKGGGGKGCAHSSTRCCFGTPSNHPKPVTTAASAAAGPFDSTSDRTASDAAHHFSLSLSLARSGGWDGFEDGAGGLAAGHGGLELLDSLAKGTGGKASS
jgi:hypothetical protein